MNTLTSFLNSLVSQLQKWGLNTPEYLQPGIDASKVQDMLATVNLTPTDELLELFSWHNGVTEKGGVALKDIQFIPGFYLLSIEEAVAHLNANKGDARWAPNWFPILANSGGDFYAVVLTDESKVSSPVVNYTMGYPEVDIEYSSIESMMETFVECANAGITFVNEGRLDMDDAKQAVVAKRLNPSVELWQDV